QHGQPQLALEAHLLLGGPQGHELRRGVTAGEHVRDAGLVGHHARLTGGTGHSGVTSDVTPALLAGTSRRHAHRPDVTWSDVTDGANVVHVVHVVLVASVRIALRVERER